MQDHLTDIFAYRNDLERDLAAVIEAESNRYGPGEPFTTADGDEYETPAAWFEGFALECLVWDRRPTGPGHVHVGTYGYESHGPAGYTTIVSESADGHIVEWLLGYGGPTVRLTYDTRWNRGELFHSWGADPRTGEPRDTIEIRGELCEWLAEWFGVTA